MAANARFADFSFTKTKALFGKDTATKKLRNFASIVSQK